MAPSPAGKFAAIKASKAHDRATSNHYGEGSDEVYFDGVIKWEEALRKGQPLPIPAKS